MKFLRYASLCLVLFTAAFITSCKKDEDALFPGNPDKPEASLGQLDVVFDHVVGSSPLQLSNPEPYRTLEGDQFTVTTFRYYISNIKLRKADGTEFVQPESYYLLDEAQPASKSFTIPNIPVGSYNSITFTIGVDAARSTGGAQTGALAVGDMFWTWDTGYIHTKLEGRSPQSRNGAIVFHIGGFRDPHNTIRVISPVLGNAIQIRESRTPELRIKADVLKMFTGPSPIRFATINNIMVSGPSAAQVANNQAAGMFTIDRITDR